MCFFSVDVEYDLLQYGAGSEGKVLDVVYSRCEIVREHFKHILHFFQSQKVLRPVDIVFIFTESRKIVHVLIIYLKPSPVSGTVGWTFLIRQSVKSSIGQREDPFIL